jgi:hypothetical protein
MYDWGHVKTELMFRSPLNLGELFWAFGKLTLLKENPA